MSTQLDPLSLSADLLYTVTTEGDSDWLQSRLASLERSALDRALSTRERTLAFWLNCYNAYAQLLLDDDDRNPIESGLLERVRFFARDQIPVGNVWLSLNDIKHGLLRHSKHPWGLGYVPRLFSSSFEQQFRLDACDPRIHFALPRSAEAVPPITVYSPADVDEQLDLAIEWYVDENVSYDPDRNTATIPWLFWRYRGDFGGKRGVIGFLRAYDAVPTETTPSLTYRNRPSAVDNVIRS